MLKPIPNLLFSFFFFLLLTRGQEGSVFTCLLTDQCVVKRREGREMPGSTRKTTQEKREQAERKLKVSSSRMI